MSTGGDVSPGERKNGWDETSLERYLRERDAAVNGMHRIGPGAQQAPRPVRVERDYDPLEW